MSAFRVVLRSFCGFLCLSIALPAYPATLQEHYNKGIEFLKKREFLDAIPHARLVYNVSENSVGRSGVQTAVLAINLAVIYSALGWYERAASYLQEAHDIIMSTTEPSDPRRRDLMKEMAGFDLKRGDYGKAADLLHQLTTGTAFDAESAPLHLNLLMFYGRSLRYSDPDLSLKVLAEAQDFATKTYGRKDIRVGNVIMEMAETDFANGRLDDAMKLYEEVVGHFKRSGIHLTWLGYAAIQDEALLLFLQGKSYGSLRVLGSGDIGRFEFERKRTGMYIPYKCRTDADGKIPPDQWVYIGYGVDGDGRVVNPRVIASKPPQVNDRAALEAMQEWSLQPDDADSLKDGLSSLRMFIRCVPAGPDQVTARDPDNAIIQGSALAQVLDLVPAPDALREARSQYRKLGTEGKEGPALDAVEDALSKAIDASEQPDLRVATAWYDYGVLLARFGHRGEARTAGQRALAAFESLYPKDDIKIVPALLLLSRASGPKGSSGYSSRAKAIIESQGGKDDLTLASILYIRATRNNFREDVEVQQSFDIFANDPNTDPQTFAARLLTYAKSQFDGENSEKVIAILKRLLSGPGKSLPPTNPYIRAAHYYLAALLGEEGRSPDDIAEATRHADAVGLEPDPEFSALISSMPLQHQGYMAYPEKARKAGLGGEAMVSYKINEFGEVDDAVIIESFPVGVFDDATLNWVKRWKYPPVMGEVPLPRMEVLVRFTFRQ